MITMNDKDIRKILIPSLSQVFDKVIEEKQIYNRGTVCADVVGIAKHQMVGYEIKSDQDNLDRLPRQIKYYTWVFDKNYIVVSTKYKDRIVEHIPDSWGVLVVTDHIEVARVALKTKNDYKTSYNLLWKQEIITKFKKDRIRGYSNKPMWKLFELVKSSYTQDEYEAYIRQSLIQRRNWKE